MQVAGYRALSRTSSSTRGTQGAGGRRTMRDLRILPPKKFPATPCNRVQVTTRVTTDECPARARLPSDAAGWSRSDVPSVRPTPRLPVARPAGRAPGTAHRCDAVAVARPDLAGHVAVGAEGVGLGGTGQRVAGAPRRVD